MRNFETKEGLKLGTTFLGDKGRTLMQTKEEEKLMWSLNESTEVLEDDCHTWALSDLMDFFFKECARATEEELDRRGWGETKLSTTWAVSEEGKLVFTR